MQPHYRSTEQIRNKLSGTPICQADAMLPLHPVIQPDARFFTTCKQPRVCMLPTERPARRQGGSGLGTPYRPEADDIDVLEPFSSALRKA